MGVQLTFAPRRRYRLSVAVWWYILVRLWVKLFVSKSPIKPFFLACLMEEVDLLQYTKLLLKNINLSTWSKGNRDGNSSAHNSYFAVFRKNFYTVWRCKETSNNKPAWILVKFLNVLYHNRTKKELWQYFLNILQRYY